MHQYYCNDCLKCSDQEKCVGKNRVRVITDYGDVLTKQMALKMESTNGKLEFAKRKEAVEWPFGNIKQNLKYIEFITRGNSTNKHRKKPNKHRTQYKKNS